MTWFMPNVVIYHLKYMVPILLAYLVIVGCFRLHKYFGQKQFWRSFLFTSGVWVVSGMLWGALWFFSQWGIRTPQVSADGKVVQPSVAFSLIQEIGVALSFEDGIFSTWFVIDVFCGILVALLVSSLFIAVGLKMESIRAKRENAATA